jgi:hypothetical protein
MYASFTLPMLVVLVMLVYSIAYSDTIGLLPGRWLTDRPPYSDLVPPESISLQIYILFITITLSGAKFLQSYIFSHTVSRL